MINEALDLLGRKVTDRITGQTGVVSSVCFDVYGCIQAIVTPPAKDGKLGESCWFDIKRLQTDGSAPVMSPPDFSAIKFGKEQGPAEKPVPR